MKYQKTIIVLSILAAVLIVTLFLYSYITSRGKTAIVEIEVAPISSSLKANDQKINAGTVKLKPGKYTITAERTGFAKQSETVELIEGENDYIGFILESNSPDTANWYSENPEDQQMIEKISSKKFDQTSEDSTKEFPILTQLPFIGPGFSYQIDYGPVNSDNKLELAITITSEESKQDALDWIKNEGYNPDDYAISYLLEGGD